jgi:hypothetical protein
MKNALNPRIIDIISSYEGDASILALNLGVLANLLNCCLYTFVAHFKGVLDHEGVETPSLSSCSSSGEDDPPRRS